MIVTGNTVSTLMEIETFITLEHLNGEFQSLPFHVTTIAQIGAPFQPIEIDPKNYAHLRDIEFTEEYPCLQERPFDILIAEPHYSHLICQQRRKTAKMSEPIATKTKLGWVLHGATGYRKQDTALNFHTSAEDAITFELAQIYKEVMQRVRNLFITDRGLKTDHLMEIPKLQSRTSLWKPLRSWWKQFRNFLVTFNAQKEGVSVNVIPEDTIEHSKKEKQKMNNDSAKYPRMIDSGSSMRITILMKRGERGRKEFTTLFSIPNPRSK